MNLKDTVKKIIYKIVCICLITAGMSLTCMSVERHSELMDAEKKNKLIAKEAYIENEDMINFKKLKKKNPDITAWIRIPDTPVDYPVVMAKDNNEFYLRHDVRGRLSSSGAVFTDFRLYGKPFECKNCIIYAHNMGRFETVMFSTLMKYEKQDYYDKHKNVYIYTEDTGKNVYRIVSVREVSTDDYAYKITFKGRNEFKGWIKENIKDSMIKTDTLKIKRYKKAITLSTCTYGSRRLVIECVPLE